MTTRIAKFIAESGVASRRRAEELINLGRVCVNGRAVDSPVCFVNDDDVVTVDGRVVTRITETVVYAFNKPINTVTTVSDPRGRRTIYNTLPMEFRSLKYIGRLDYRTTGLLLLTNDGELARILTLPSSNIPRVYIATVTMNDDTHLDDARRGMTVDGIHYAPMKIARIDNKTLRVEITEGKKNEVRIVLAACGAPVRGLHRVSFGKIKLGNLKSGKIRPVPQKTIDEMLRDILPSHQ